MKKQIIKSSIFFAAALPVGLAVVLSTAAILGCSAENRTVDNHPPEIPTNVASADTRPQFGTLIPQSITAFYWPEGINEEEMRVAARHVRAASLKIDDAIQKIMGIQKVQLPKLEAAFLGNACVEDWATKSGKIEGSTVAWVMDWRALEPVGAVQPVGENDPQYPEYVKYQDYLSKKKVLDGCVANQTQRQGLLTVLKGALDEQKSAMLSIATTIDKDPTKPVNMKTVSADGSVDGSKIVLKQAEDGAAVEVNFKDFMLPGYSPSSSATNPALKVYNAAYMVNRKLLVFGVPELVVNPNPAPNEPVYVPTGAIIECALERGPDFLGMARFSGEMKLKKDGVTLRYGSISITGALAPNP